MERDDSETGEPRDRMENCLRRHGEDTEEQDAGIALYQGDIRKEPAKGRSLRGGDLIRREDMHAVSNFEAV